MTKDNVFRPHAMPGSAGGLCRRCLVQSPGGAGWYPADRLSIGPAGRKPGPDRWTHFERGRLAANCRRMLARAHERHQAPLAPPVHFEQFLIRNFLDLLPDGGVAEALPPVGVEVDRKSVVDLKSRHL